MRFFVDGSITTPTTEYLTNPKYQQVEYLESTGTQWIDTDILANGSFDAEYKIKTDSTEKRDSIVAGARTTTQQLNFGQFNTSTKSFTLAYLNTYWTVSNKIDLNTEYKVKVHYESGNQYAVLNGETIGNRNLSGTELLDTNVYLFKRNFHTPSSETILPMICRMYYFKMWNNGTLVRNFIPVIRKEDGKPGMYDKVSGQFFTNAGTGEFLYGNPVYSNVPKGYKECEYLESTGTQYIDTGFKPNPATTKIDCAFCGLPNASTQMFGVRTVAASNNENNTNICFGIAYSKIYIRGDWIRNPENLVSDIEPEEYIHLIAHNQTMYINDVEYTYNSAKNNTYLDYSFCLFACNTAGSISFYNKIRQYYFKIYDNGILVRDYVPVLRKADNAPGMYDRVSNTFFTNSGKGAFTYKLKERQTEKVTRIVYSGSKMRLVRNTTT